MLSIPAPLLSQFADEEILLQIGSIARPGLLTREPSENGIRLITSADPGDVDALRAAADEFQILLGVLRAWRPTAGQRQDEISPRVGPGPVRDGHGNQFLAVTPALYYRTTETEIIDYATKARAALEHSSFLRSALWLNGRRDRSAADAYMVYEYARRDFSDVAAALEVSQSDIRDLTQSANNLAPERGGRHATGRVQSRWDLDQILNFTGRILIAWIVKRARDR
jgi:hypothetical protein